MNITRKKNLNTNQNLEDNIGESLSNMFERMVSQMDLITNSFANFDQRLERMEKLVDEMNEEDLKNNNIQ
jgi:K+/H+ antiporter YhaU regulatory subunit KhtT